MRRTGIAVLRNIRLILAAGVIACACLPLAVSDPNHHAEYDRAMQYRTFGRTGWQVSEIGYGMWGMAGWTGSDDEESRQSLDRAVALGCNFFDTAWAYGEGRSEQLLGELLKRHRDKRLYTATKIPPKNRRWPARSEYALDEVFPADYIREYTENSLRNIDVATVDLQQF